MTDIRIYHRAGLNLDALVDVMKKIINNPENLGKWENRCLRLSNGDFLPVRITGKARLSIKKCCCKLVNSRSAEYAFCNPELDTWPLYQLPVGAAHELPPMNNSLRQQNDATGKKREKKVPLSFSVNKQCVELIRVYRKVIVA